MVKAPALIVLVACLLPEVATAAEPKKDLRGVRPGMTVAEAVAILTRDGATCADGLDDNDTYFIGVKNVENGKVVHQPNLRDGKIQTGTVFCTYKSGGSDGNSHFIRDTIIMDTFLSGTAEPEKPLETLPNGKVRWRMPAPTWDDIQGAKILTVDYRFASKMTDVDMSKIILSSFQKSVQDVQALKGSKEVPIILRNRSSLTGTPHIDLGSGLFLILNATRKLNESGGRQFTLSLTNNDLMKIYFKEVDDEYRNNPQVMAPSVPSSPKIDAPKL